MSGHEHNYLRELLVNYSATTKYIALVVSILLIFEIVKAVGIL